MISANAFPGNLEEAYLAGITPSTRERPPEGAKSDLWNVYVTRAMATTLATDFAIVVSRYSEDVET